MPKFPISPISFINADIPIYLETSHARRSSEGDKSAEHICPKCSTNSRDQSIHCISVSPAPPSYQSVTLPTPSPGKLAVPNLNVKTSDHRSQPFRPNRPEPTFRPHEEGRSRVRFRHNAFSPISPHLSNHELDNSRSGHAGLGIPEAPFKPDVSPITPGTAEKAEGTNSEKENKGGPFAALNLAQRIEQRLWKYRESQNVVKRWLVEIISWTFSFFCMAGIVIVLYFYQNGPLPHWPMGLTINAYISVLAKVASAALLLPVSEALGQLKWNWFQAKSENGESKKMWDFELFDNASRGPWGSFMLLLRTKGKSLAALGAAVTLFALAMDPFFQQVVSFPEQWRMQPTNGSIPRAFSYHVYAAGIYLKDNEDFLEIDQSMTALACRYFYDNGTRSVTGSNGKGVGPAVPLSCPSSRCTWSQYETLATCNRCVSIADRLEFHCQTSALDWIPTPNPLPDASGWMYPNGTACGWFLKAEKPILMTGYTTDLGTNYTGTALVSRSQPLYDVFTRAPLSGYDAKLNNTRNPLSHVIIVSNENVQRVQLNATPTAHECIIFWFVKTMQSTLTGGEFIENVTRTVYNHTLGKNPWSTEQVYDDGELLGIQFTYVENVTIVGNSGKIFQVLNDTHNNILTIFDDIFPSTYTVANSTNMTDAKLRFQEYITGGSRLRTKSFNPFLYDNITAHLDSLAIDFTNIIRSAQDTIDIVQGASFDLTSVVDVRWKWLSLPLTLLAFIFVFLMATVVRNSKERDVGVWKTSAIATLLYGLPDEVRKKLTSVKDKGTPRANAKHTKLKLLPGTGWRLSGASVFSPSSLRARHSPSQTEWNRR